MTHTMTCVTPVAVVEHWLEQEIDDRTVYINTLQRVIYQDISWSNI